MRNEVWLVIIMLAVAFSLPAAAVGSEQQKEPYPYPWEKGYLAFGGYIASLNSGVTLGGSQGLGVSVDVESLLGLDTTDSSFRITGGYRLGKNRRHKLELSWFRFNREGENTITEAIPIPPEIGGEPGEEIGPGVISSFFNFDIYKFKYEYSFVLDERADLNIGIGLFVMPIEFGISYTVTGLTQGETEESITAPLPVFGIGFDFAIIPKWFLRQQLEFFYLEYDNFTGAIKSLRVALEYYPWQHVGFGLAFDGLDVDVEATKESDYPGLGDFVGTIGFETIGAELYLKILF